MTYSKFRENRNFDDISLHINRKRNLKRIDKANRISLLLAKHVNFAMFDARDDIVGEWWFGKGKGKGEGRR